MNKRTVKKNNMAVSAPLEFTIAFGIVIIGLFFLIASVNTLFVVYDVPDNDLRAKAIEISDILISNPGLPEDWDEDLINIPTNINRLGFVKQGESFGVLDSSKINAICSLSNNKYNDVKSALGLENSPYETYDFYFVIKILGSDKKYEYGASYENAQVIKSFERYVTIDSNDAVLTVFVFR